MSSSLGRIASIDRGPFRRKRYTCVDIRNRTPSQRIEHLPSTGKASLSEHTNKSSISIAKPRQSVTIVHSRIVRRRAEATLKLVALDLSSFALHAVVASTGYTFGLFTAQSIGHFCRVSCATPVLGSVLGAIGVAAASAIAGQFSKSARLVQKHGIAAFSLPAFKHFQAEHIIADILIGMSFYKMLGGKFRNVMPSDLFCPGAFATRSIPARVSIYATPSERSELSQYFKQYGCHSCGRRRGQLVADHIPPTKFTLLADPMAIADRLGIGKPARLLTSLLDISFQPPAQRFYPQCNVCSSKQGSAVRANKRVLVFHRGGPRLCHSSGISTTALHLAEVFTAVALLVGLWKHESERKN